jgi:hypothetical protein
MSAAEYHVKIADEEYRDPGTFSFGIEFEFPAMGRSRMALRTIDNSYLLRRRRL